jgi:hypothetical protein
MLTAASVSSPGRPALGTVVLSATPEHAEVSVDGDFVGNAPVNLKLTPGKHTITVSAKGYQGLTRDLTVMPDSEVRLTANLEQ